MLSFQKPIPGKQACNCAASTRGPVATSFSLPSGYEHRRGIQRLLLNMASWRLRELLLRHGVRVEFSLRLSRSLSPRAQDSWSSGGRLSSPSSRQSVARPVLQRLQLPDSSRSGPRPRPRPAPQPHGRLACTDRTNAPVRKSAQLGGNTCTVTGREVSSLAASSKACMA